MTHVAIIDLGTNTFHLLIAKVGESTLEVLHKEKRSVKIGEGGINQGIISSSAEQRALDALAGFKKTMDQHQVNQSYAFATSAFRNAINGQQLAQKVKQHTGISISIISGEQEAQYIFQGVQHALDIGLQDALIMDIGGGSVEFIIANQNEVRWKESFEIGAQRLMDHFHYHDPIFPEEIIKLESLLDSRLMSLASAMEQYNPRVLIGSSGTFDTLSEIFCLEQGITSDKDLPEKPLTISGYKNIHQEIISYTREERMAIPGMIEMRVDMIVVASCLINYLLRRFALEQIRVSAFALKEGVLDEVLGQIRNSGLN